MRPIFPWYIPIQRTLETPFGSFHGPSLPNMTNCHRQFHPVRNETRALTTGSTTGLVLLWQLTGGPETSRSLNVWQRKEKKKKSLLFPFQSQIIEETKGKTKRNHWPKTMHLSRARQSGTPCFLLPVPPSLWVPPLPAALLLKAQEPIVRGSIMASVFRYFFGKCCADVALSWKLLCCLLSIQRGWSLGTEAWWVGQMFALCPITAVQYEWLFSSARIERTIWRVGFGHIRGFH